MFSEDMKQNLRVVNNKLLFRHTNISTIATSSHTKYGAYIRQYDQLYSLAILSDLVSENI